MLKIKRLLVFVFSIFTLLSAPAHATVPGLIEPGTLKVAVDSAFPPFGMSGHYAGHRLDGLEVRLLTEIARRLSLKLEPVAIVWEGVLPGVLSKSFDFSAVGMDITEQRNKSVDFIPWITSNACLIGKKGSFPNSHPQLSELTVGTLVGSTFADLAKEKGAKEIKFYQSLTDACIDLVNGNLGGVITEKLQAEYLIGVERLPIVMLDPHLTPPIDQGWAFRKDSVKLRETIAAVLADMQEDGTYQLIIEEVLNKKVP